jgi:TfoX/Sxy family transcriptional regulator of competence genes
MAYNEKLADRIREIIAVTHKNVEEKKMFAGLCFMVNDKMCVGVHEDKIMVRLDPAVFDEVIEKEGCEPMNFTGKIMRGFVFVNEGVLKTKKQLEYWVKLGVDYNQFAKSSKKPANKPKRAKK